MKFGLTHRILTSALATLGVLAIVLSGALPKVTVALLVIGLVFALVTTERFQQSTTARYAAAIVPSLVLGVELLRFVSGAPLLELAVEFAAALQIVRLATRRGATHDQQVVLLALLHLVAGTVLGGGLAYGVCLFGFLVLAPGALVLSHLRREVEGNYRQGARDRTGLPVDVPRILRSRRVIGPGFLALTCLLSLPIILFTALLFVLFPRVGFSLLLFQSQHPGRITGFSDSVDLSNVGKLREDPAIVVRFRLSDPPTGAPPQKMILRLRGTAFDEYQGGGKWSRTSTDRIRCRGSAPTCRCSGSPTRCAIARSSSSSSRSIPRSSSCPRRPSRCAGPPAPIDSPRRRRRWSGARSPRCATRPRPNACSATRCSSRSRTRSSTSRSARRITSGTCSCRRRPRPACATSRASGPRARTAPPRRRRRSPRTSSTSTSTRSTRLRGARPTRSITSCSSHARATASSSPPR
ncbi:MAG: DUF3488 domain-containing protein [Myxococcales bacterium]|nr:DUF3488 domain-containing protein [Myxococcales bacterium]